tara:strand:+ start:5884 stop:7152 length:1269 start_codon:yes stop_codon:yes gene_type:complete
MKIKDIKAYEVLDSRGNPTVGVEVILSDESIGAAFVPSGASTGKYEAIEKRDSDNDRYLGKGVLKAVNSIHDDILPLLRDKDVFDLFGNDLLMLEADGTDSKENFGANAVLAVSMACAKAASISMKISLHNYITNKASEFYDRKIEQKLPIPMLNILNGGAHADNPIDFQEFMIRPFKFDSFSDSLRCGVEIFHTLKQTLEQKNLNTSVGDEGGFAPNLETPESALDLIMEAIEKAGYKPGEEVNLCLDVAATEFYCDSIYRIQGKQDLNSSEMIDYLKALRNSYPIYSIEDGLDEDDWQGWKILTKELGSKTQLVGDDLFVTNTARIKKGIEECSANAVLIKLNQIGSLSETFQAIKLSEENNFKNIISHRSGETEDTFIADLSVGMGVGQIKTGAPSRSDRVAKYNRLLMIEKNSDICFG